MSFYYELKNGKVYEFDFVPTEFHLNFQDVARQWAETPNLALYNYDGVKYRIESVQITEELLKQFLIIKLKAEHRCK